MDLGGLTHTGLPLLAQVVLSCDPVNGTVLARCTNTATIGCVSRACVHPATLLRSNLHLSASGSERKNCNLPGVIVDLPTITEKDTEDLLDWGVPNQVDFVAASFVRKGTDVSAIRRVLGKGGENIKIISKVENQEGLVNFDSILTESDGIMVARGDLGMEIPTEKIFLAQKMMITKCKCVTTGTGLLQRNLRKQRLVSQSARSSLASLQRRWQARGDRHADAGEHDQEPAAHTRGGDGRGQRGAGRHGLRDALGRDGCRKVRAVAMPRLPECVVRRVLTLVCASASRWRRSR